MMKKYLLLLVLVLVLKAPNTHAAIIPVKPSQPAATTISLPAQFASLSLKQIQKSIGRKLTLKEKIGIKVLQWKMKRSIKRAGPGEKTNTGSLAMSFAIIGLVSLLLVFVGIPFLFFLSGIATLLALIFGYKGQRENPADKKAKTAIILGWITFLLILATLLVALIAFSGGWGFG